MITTSYVELGAREGLIGKTGVIPARSRHCNEEWTQGYTTETQVLGRFGQAMIQSQENCLSDNHRFLPTSDGEGIKCMYYMLYCTYIPAYFCAGILINIAGMLLIVSLDLWSRDFLFWYVIVPYLGMESSNICFKFSFCFFIDVALG